MARSLGIQGGLGGLEPILRGRLLSVDVGQAEVTDQDGRSLLLYFLNNADVGVGARIAERGSSLKRVGGRAAFFLSSVGVLADPQPWSGTLALNGGEAQSVNAVTVVAALGPYTGGGMRIAPAAKVDDGVFDVILIDAMSSAELIANLPRIYAGTHLSHPAVHAWQASEVRIATAERPPIELDGEVVGVGGATLRILPSAISVYVNKP
jgi:diacylglycerol kinase (ATP)